MGDPCYKIGQSYVYMFIIAITNNIVYGTVTDNHLKRYNPSKSMYPLVSVTDMNFRLVVSIYMYKTARLYLKGQFPSYRRTVYPVDVGFH